MPTIEKLDQLFSRGARLSDVAPDVRGIPLRKWRMLMIEKQCAEVMAKLDKQNAPLSQKRIWTKRDDYGLKGA